MKLIFIKKYSFERLMILSIGIFVFHLLSMNYFTKFDLENVNMEAVLGHKIIIDPGHGGIDSGATANQVIEKQVTMAISIKLAEVLQKHGALVTLTRSDDIDYYTKGKGGKRNDLLKRIQIIEESGAELFISIHCNAFHGINLSGAQVFYSPHFLQNKIVAETLQQALRDFPPNNKRQVKEDLHILLLNGTKIPGVLIETGYITNPKEALLLVNDEYQQQLVEQIGKALAYYFSQNVTK